MRKYFGDCSSYKDFAGLFHDRKDELPSEENIVAVELFDDSYSSSMKIFYKNNGEIFEEKMSHCSCNGYDDWLPVTGTKITKEYVNTWVDCELKKTVLAAF